jgi:threonine/homoserine/homoserine lactone efflux protein
MAFIVSISSIFGVQLIGVISPSPRFLFVAQTFISTGRSNGFAAAIGMGVGALSFPALTVCAANTFHQGDKSNFIPTMVWMELAHIQHRLHTIG